MRNTSQDQGRNDTIKNMQTVIINYPYSSQQLVSKI